MNKKSVIAAVAVFVILVGVGYFAFGRSSEKVAVNADNVATVNGVAILKTAYDTQLASAIASIQLQGGDVTSAESLAQIKAQVLNDLISNELVNQGIASDGIKTTPEEIEAQYQAVLTQAGSVDGLKAELVKAGMTEAQLRENIARQLAVQAYLLKNVDTASITVSDEEIAQFYTDYSKAQKDAGQTVPALKDLKEQIKQQLISNKQQALVTSFIESLRINAKIETTI